MFFDLAKYGIDQTSTNRFPPTLLPTKVISTPTTLLRRARGSLCAGLESPWAAAFASWSALSSRAAQAQSKPCTIVIPKPPGSETAHLDERCCMT
jgi:hypothetical protein